ncbi:MAG: hypothetical protein KC416_12070, partial [Myxococcales bacterium]|nr:hypothetical protein [Myxococcales bacterium]
WVGPFKTTAAADVPIDIRTAPGPIATRRYMQFRVVFNRSGALAPRLRDLEVDFTCAPSSD